MVRRPRRDAPEGTWQDNELHPTQTTIWDMLDSLSSESVTIEDLLARGHLKAESATVGSGIVRMSMTNQPFVMLVDGEGKLSHLATHRDYVKRAVAGNLPLDTPLTQIATPNPSSFRMSASPASMLQNLLTAGHRTGPAIDSEGKPIGATTLQSCLVWFYGLTEELSNQLAGQYVVDAEMFTTALSQLLESTVGDIMLRVSENPAEHGSNNADRICFEPDAMVGDVLKMLNEQAQQNVRHALIRSSGSLLLKGIISDLNLIRAYKQGQEDGGVEFALDMPINEVPGLITTNVSTLTPDMSLGDAVRQFREKRYNQFPVVTPGTLNAVGIMPMSRLAHALVEAEAGDMILSRLRAEVKVPTAPAGA